MSGIPQRQRARTPTEKRVVHPVGFPVRYREGIPDIFIPPLQVDNAGVIRGRNENSGMTMRGTRETRVTEGQK